MQNCDDCRKIIALDLELEKVLHEQFHQVEVPAQVRKKIEQNIPDKDGFTKSMLFRWSFVPALAIAAMLVIFLFPFNGSFASMDELGMLAIADHESHIDRPCTKGIPENLSAWGEDTIGLRITRPVLPFSDCELIGVSMCRLGDCYTAHLLYNRNGEKISVFIFPEKEANFSLVADRNYSLEYGPHRVTIWKTNNQIYAMVT